MSDESGIRWRFEALTAGRGGIRMVSRATGIARSTIGRGLIELRDGGPLDAERVRRSGGGRKPSSEMDASRLDDLRHLVGPPRRHGIACAPPATRGDPESPLLWTSKGLRKLADGLRGLGHMIGHNLVGALSCKLGYSLQGNRKTREGTNHPDRHAQFHYINDQVTKTLAAGAPAISGDLRRRNWSATSRTPATRGDRRGHPSRCACTTFSFQSSVAPRLEPGLGLDPGGRLDIGDNAGWVSVGIDCRAALARTHDTASFAVNAIRGWWKSMGRARSPKAGRLLTTPPSTGSGGGGSNGSRMHLWKVELWKVELQKLADERGLAITVCHLPPGTSKWNKIEHRMLSYITGTWRGTPLVSHKVIVQLFAATTPKTGLTVRCELDLNKYPARIKVSDDDLATINILHHEFHGEWNYTISPRRSAQEQNLCSDSSRTPPKLEIRWHLATSRAARLQAPQP